MCGEIAAFAKNLFANFFHSLTPERTDVIQIMLMYGTLFLIVIKGTMDVGGLSVVIERNFQSGRFEAPE